MIITGIGSSGGIGVTTLMANMFHVLLEKGRDVYWLSLSNLIPPLFCNNPMVWLDYEPITRKIPSWKRENCMFCDECIKVCNCGAISRYSDFYVIYSELCISCGACVYACKKKAISFESKKIGMIEQLQSNPKIFRINLSAREILSPSHCKSIIQMFQKKLPKESFIIIDLPSGFRELWAELINLSDKIVFYNNDLYTWEMMYKSLSHDQAEVVLAVNSNYYEAFAEHGYSFALSVPHSREINAEAINGKRIIDKMYQKVVDDLIFSLNIEPD